MSIKAVFFDVDCTLTAGINQPVVLSAIVAIKQLQQKGIKIIIASGRMPYGIKAIEGQINPDYYIGANGQIVCDSQGDIIDISLIDKETFVMVTKYCKENKLGLFWKFAQASYVYSEFNNYDEIAQSTNLLYPYENPDDSQLPTSGALICSKEEMYNFKKEFDERLDVIDGGFILYDLDKKGKSKKDGLLALTKVLNISPEETMAFGDSDNDVEMLKCAGISIAMGNGFDSVKKVADYVTDAAVNDGIVKALKKYHLL
ncbi:MAG: Cof-type HAD-IIB family hydrolase [Erysipelotrichia bacterium]|nr:Cof-type HAD-IIB family hydrolase [Erysipelotrichia bacterium]